MKPLSHPLHLCAVRWGIALSALGALSACSHLPSSLQTGRQLQASEVRQLFSGRTVTSRNLSSGVVSVTHYTPDGRVRQQREGLQRLGTWRVLEDGRICLRMETRDESCRWVRQESDGRYQKYRDAHLFARPVVAYIGLNAPSVSPSPQASVQSTVPAAIDGHSQVIRVQQMLNRSGFDAGPVDGLWGRRTEAAWHRFQAAQGLPRTDRVDSLTLGRLSAYADSRP